MALRKMVLASVFTALLIIATLFQLPIGPVPLTMQPLVVMLAGLILDGYWGAASVGLWALLGILGLPVFAGGKAGIAVLMGPTGGFIIGFIMCALIIGLLRGDRKLKFWPAVGIVMLGLIAAYAVGLTGFLFNMQYFLHKSLTLYQALELAVIPFVPWDIGKAFLAVYMGIKIKTALGQ